ncbi:MAG: ATP-binding protein [Oscillospiraceae bacterium]|nr:ATP-binding protein [Oscillospiraceae bacterium]
MEQFILCSEVLREVPFQSYEAYTDSLFACVDKQLSAYIENLMGLFAADNGGFKNILYPDIEIAHDLCEKHLTDFTLKSTISEELQEVPAGDSLEDLGDLDALFGAFSGEAAAEAGVSVEETLDYISHRASLTNLEEVPMPLYALCSKLNFSPFTTFVFACGVLSSTQTNYASIFQVVNQNGSLSAPTIESAGRVFYGEDFTITKAFGAMSKALEELAPVLSLRINDTMPFTTVISPDKRIIDFLFSSDPLRIDQSYSRFFSMLTGKKALEPFIANQHLLDAVNIAFDGGSTLFNLWGDEGSGRKFTISHFCAGRSLGCISVDCGKLFVYDFSFVEKALWAVCRECILTDSCVCLDNLGYREEEKDKFFGYMDLAFGKLLEREITVFAVSQEKLPMKEMTRLDFTQLELPTPGTGDREQVWQYYAKGHPLGEDVVLSEMATKFLFTPGKIKNALHQSRSLAAMAKQEQVMRSVLFQSCYNQMSHELTKKATRIQANFGWDDIVMNPDQRLALKNACDQLIYRKQVYEDWNYTKKYQYGRGLSVLLFGAPGTGKSMCAQVIAHEMNLELYRVDLSKVVDKYVGETEKAISMIFREAKKCNVVLFFDECDTLFAKRSDDGGSNQSSNNNKTALLLQEVEAYDGVSVLATNYKHNIDPAFFRRMKFIVEFQFPDVETRKVLWTTTIPKSTPLAEDVDIDFLAQRFEFVGGNIKNCILNAAFLAAADPEAGGEVHMKHYLQAIKYEFVKTGKVFTRSDFEPYAHLVL